MSRIKCGGLKNDPIGTTPVIMPKNADVSRLSVPMAVNSRSSADQRVQPYLAGDDHYACQGACRVDLTTPGDEMCVQAASCERRAKSGACSGNRPMPTR